MIFQLFDWFPKSTIWAIIIKFDQIRKILCWNFGGWKKIFRGVVGIKEMSRFEEVSLEEIKRIADNANPINTKRSTKYGLKSFIGKSVLNAIKYL